MPQVSQDVLQVLDAAIVDGALLRLDGSLDRKLYLETNKVIEAAGGKWDKKARAHVFDGAAIDVIEPIILTGEYRRTKQDFGQFDTPTDLACDLVELTQIEPGMTVLEPSAGIGRLAAAAARVGGHVTCYEIDAKRAAALPAVSTVHVCDFLSVQPEQEFDRVLMNPPFAKQDDIRHVLHAFQFLRPGGRLTAIMSAGVMFRTNKSAAEFRDFVRAHRGTIKALPEGSFMESGTGVNTCVVTLEA